MNAMQGGHFDFDIQETDQVAVVHVRGSAGMAEAEIMTEQLGRLADRQIPLIVLDLSQMDFISSMGLGAIITGHLKSRHHNGQIRLVNPQPPVRQLLETTRLTKLFPVYESVDKAMETSR